MKGNKRKLNKKGKLLLYIIGFIIFLLCGLFLLLKSFGIQDEKVINYKEQSDLDYKVYLKDNDFYEEKYLGKDMLYIANLIDNIKVDFNYDFTIDEVSNIDFTYDIIAKLVIADESGKNSYFEKSYMLLENKKVSMTNNNYFNIKEDIDIDYNYYNSLANNFKMSYGINPSSNLIIYLRINKEDAENKESIIINSSSMMSITIPLSERSVNINMDYKEIDETSKLISKSDVLLENALYLASGILLVVLSLIMMIKSMRLLNLSGKKKSLYEKYVSKILREYDRLIVETSTKPLLDEKDIIYIEKFEELLDVRDNLKQPIMYYITIENSECYFYINYEDKIYLNVVNEDKLNSKRTK